MAAPKRTNPHHLALDASVRSSRPAMGAAGVVCARCGSGQVIPIPIWELIQESEADGEISWVVPVALVCLTCQIQRVYLATGRMDRQEAEGG